MQVHCSSNNSTQLQQTTSVVPIPCTICGVSSRGSIYGAIACHACKAFFKRHANDGLNALKCHFDGHCEINIHTRHTCAFCRLNKCFASGMQVELIRCPHWRTKQKKKKVNVKIHIAQSNHSAQISTLSDDQWNFLFHLSLIYDVDTALSIAQQYMSQQTNLPHKLRFKCASLLQLFQVMSNGTASLYTNNKDFLSLPSNDRSILLHHTFMTTAVISSSLIFYKIRLIDEPAFHCAVQSITSRNEISLVRSLFEQLDFDVIIIKLFLVILSFSTFRYTIYPSTSSGNLSNVRQVVHIQDRYIEMTWRYFVHKYGDKMAMKYFSDFTRCFLVMNAALVDVYQMPWFAETINSVIEKTEQALPLHI